MTCNDLWYLCVTSSSFELFFVTIVEEDVCTLRERSRSVWESSVRLRPPR